MSDLRHVRCGGCDRVGHVKRSKDLQSLECALCSYSESAERFERQGGYHRAPRASSDWTTQAPPREWSHELGRWLGGP